MDAEKAAILDEIADLNAQAVSISERVEKYVFGRVEGLSESLANPITDAIVGLSRHVVFAQKAGTDGR